jgi:hypothetical protein
MTTTASDLAAETTAVRTELARVDTKAGIVLASAGTAFSVLAASLVLASTLPGPARVALGLAVALLAVSASLALWVIRPVIPRRGGGTGFVAYADLDAPALLAGLAADPHTRQAGHLIHLSRIAKGKCRRLAASVTLMLGALAVVVVSVLLAL